MTTVIERLESMDLRSQTMVRLFSDYQKARFAEIYFHKRASILRRHLAITKFFAAATSSAAVVGVFASVPFGDAALKILVVAAALAAIANLVKNWDATAARYEKAALGYSIVRDLLNRLLGDIKRGDLMDEHSARASEIDAMSTALTALDDAPDDKLILLAWEQTERELPSDKAWDLV